MARLPNADDALQFDNENDYFRVVLADTARLVVCAAGVQVPNDFTVSGNLTVVGTISPISGVFPNFNVTNTLHVSGAVNNPVGSLILTSSNNSSIAVSGNLMVTQNAVISGNLAVEGSVSNSSGFLILNDATHVSGALTATSVTTTANVSGLTASFGNLSASGDITARGGFIRSYRFIKCAMTGATSTVMTASQGMIGTSLYSFPAIELWAPGGGSVLGYSITTAEGAFITAGAITASITVGGNTGSMQAAWDGGLGTLGDYTNKDRMTFLNGWDLGVSLTASEGYLTDISPLSCSYIVDVIIEA